MNTRAKGNRVRLACMKELRKQGWEVDIVEQRGKFQTKDLFGLFDLLAIRMPSQLLFVQVTCRYAHPHLAYTTFTHNHPGFVVQQWVWVDRKGFKIYHYDKGQVLFLGEPL